MPRLFIKIFLWFWLAMTLIGGVLVTLTLTTNPQQAFVERQKQRLSVYGQDLIRIYEEKGSQGLTEKIAHLHEKENIRMALIDVKIPQLDNQPQQPYLKDFALRALTGSMLPPIIGKLIPSGGKKNHNFTINLNDDYLLLVEMPKPSQLQLFLNPNSLSPRLGAIFLIAGIISYLLARSISNPIMKLRTAAQEFSTGNLSTRVSPGFGQKKGELAELAHDFDTMAERIESLLASQQRLLRDISHELRSPLARLGVALELARRDTPGNAAPLARIEQESERLNDLIGQLLTITRMESLTEIKTRERINLAELLEAIVDDANFESQVINRKVSINISRKVSLNGSHELLARAFENVIRNGLHHTAEGSEVNVHLDLTADGKFAEIKIRDHGQGVPPEALSELFRPFYRVSESRDRVSGGSGVGLAITEGAIKLHGGRIWAANHPHGGMLFTILLPI